MANLSAIIICDGAVLSFGCWTLVGITRTIWGDGLPCDARFGVYVCLSEIRTLTRVVFELYDPIASVHGETGALKWRHEEDIVPKKNQDLAERFVQAQGSYFRRAIEHELHIKIDG